MPFLQGCGSQPGNLAVRVLRVIGLVLLFIGMIHAAHIIVEAWSWTLRFSLVGIWDAKEVTQAYTTIQSCMILNLATTTAGVLILSAPSYSSYLIAKSWSLLNFKRILAAMVLTGGTVYAHAKSNKYSVRYYGKSIILHKVFSSLVGRIYGVIAEPTRWGTRSSYVTQVYRKEIVEDLLMLSPTYNTRNGHWDGDEGLCPNATFLEESPIDVINEAVRLGASSNGSVRYSVEPIADSDGRCQVRPQFTFAYLSPKPLLQDYQKALDRVGIHTAQMMDNRFGKGFLLGRSWDALTVFSSIGGFIDGVKVERGRYCGLERNGVLRGLLAFRRNQSNNFATREKALQTVEGCLEPPRNSTGRLLEMLVRA